MIEEASVILEEFDNRTPVRVRQAAFVEVTAQGGAVVDMLDSRFIADFGTGFIPMSGETVRIMSIGERHLLFPARPLPGVGTVLAVSGDWATVQTVIGEYRLPFVGDAPTAGNLVALEWSEVPRVVGKLSTSPDTVEPPPNPGGGTVRSATFRAIDTGSHNVGSGNYWQAQPWASNTTLGGWFYGTQIRDTIPAGASLVKIEFFVAWRQNQGDSPNFGLHGLARKSGQLSFTNVAPWRPGGGWRVAPSAWFNALKAGGNRLGVGLQHGGYNKFASRAEDSMSGALRIHWRA